MRTAPAHEFETWRENLEGKPTSDDRHLRDDGRVLDARVRCRVRTQ